MEQEMIRSGIGIALLASLVGISGCATRAETVGTFTGAAVGAGVGGGTVGTVGGAMVGYAAGRAYDARHN
jgi:hypothetical protein